MSKPEKITIDNTVYVRADSRALADPVDGLRYVIVRCSAAGVHAGFLKHREGQEVTLLKSRRLWRWYGHTLSGLALDGSPDPQKCKYAPEIPEITLLDACEIIPCTDAGMRSIREEVSPWKND